ncbi:MAG: FG-GAP-like repeat-containing protein, partial [Bacteroidota bacterium]|nr:FG-GAP-like repeat-containing protein [Bacteroidota bacterium]
MKWKYIVPVLLITFGAQTILAKGSDLSLSSPENSTGTHQAQNNVTLITGNSYSPGSSGTTASLAIPMINASTVYGTPVDPANRTVNTSYLVGATKDALNVNQAGGANYAIPIDVLPGVNGLAPSLSLVYSSNSGPGVAGYGWQIGGISTVGRSGQNYYNDGAARGVELDYNDKFTLDGQQLALTSGTYGYNLATYQTEIEQFTRVQSQLASGNGPLKFLAQTKSGLKNLYGVNDDGRQTITGYSEVLNWYISQTTDLYGNLVSYTYLKDNSTIYPSEITYGPNKVSFSYSDRADITTSYFKGQKIQQRFLLDKITVSYNNTVVKTYEMKYILISDNYNNYSALNEVVESGTGGGRLNSTAFSYQVPANVAMAQALYNTTHAYVTYQSRMCTGDFNGDGKADFLCLPDATKGASWTGMQICYSDVYDTFSSFLALTNTIDLSKLDDIQALDINGDGKDDILYELVTAGNSTFYYMLNNGTSFGSPVTLTTMTNGANTGMNGKSRRKNNKQENDNQLSGVDYDGDGVNDIFLNDPSGNWKIYSLANSSGVLTSAMILKASGTISTLADQTLSADFNGDGKADIWSFDDTGVKIYAFSGASLTSLYTSAVTSKNHFFTLGDFNSDGKVDVFIYGQKIGSTEYDWANWQVQLSTGLGFEVTTIPQKKSNLKNDYVRLGDFNGDGCTDLMITSLNQSWTGTYFYITKNKGTDFYSHTLAGYPAELNNFYLGDYNGDGRTDFVSTDGASPWWTGYQLYRTTGNTAPLLEQIGDGLNQLTTIAYTKLSQASSLIYQQGSTIPSFPVFNYQGPMPVMNSVSFDNGIGGTNTVGYGYEGAKIHRQGKGFICFTKMTVTDITAVLHTTTQSGYDATYYYPQVTAITKTADSQPMIAAGPIDVSSADQLSLTAESPTGVSSLASGTTLETITNTWAQTVLDATNKRIFPYVQSSVQTDTRTGNSVTSSISTIDSYGNPTQAVKSYSNGVSETTVTNYTNTVNTTDWNLGRVDNSTVTSAKTGETSVSQTVRFTYSTDGILKPDYIYYNEGTALAYYKNHDYDSKGNLTQVYVNGTSVGASQTNYAYDANGIRGLTVTDPLGHVSTNTYDTYGRLYTETDYLSNVNTYQYDALARQTSVSNTNGSQATTAYVWTGLNKPASGVYGVTQTGNNGSASTAWYDKLQREVRRVKTGFGGQMILIDSEYDVLGQIYRVSDPYFDGGSLTWAETYTYNYARLTDITRSSGRNSHFDYSSTRVTETTAGETKWKETDSQGLITTASDNGGNIVYAYYPDGKVKNITAPGSVVTSMQYADAARNQTQMIEPSAGTINYTYDGFGRVKTQTDARGRLTTNTYLPDGRMDNVVNPEGTTTYTYNTNKQLTGISNSTTGVSRTYGYDTKGRLITVGETIAGSNFSTSFTSDWYGRLSTRTHPSAIVETMNYNSYGYLWYISAGGSTRYTITSMNAREQLTAATYGSGTTLNAAFGFDTYGYPSSSQAGTVQDYRYVFNDINGNLTSRQN